MITTHNNITKYWNLYFPFDLNVNPIIMEASLMFRNFLLSSQGNELIYNINLNRVRYVYFDYNQ